jgi:hypothetical protein
MTDDETVPAVIHHYEITAAGKGRISFEQIRALIESAGLRVVSMSKGLVCGPCRGRGTIVRPDHRGCIVLESDRIPCPAGCDNGRPTDEVRHAAIRAGEV